MRADISVVAGLADGLAGCGEQVELLEVVLLDGIGERRVFELSGDGLSVCDDVGDELFQGCSARLVGAVLGEEKEGEGGDGVGVGGGCGWVDDRGAWVFGEDVRSGGDGRGRAFLAGKDVFSGLVLDGDDGKVVLLGVGELDVADGTGRLADLLGDALGALSAKTDRPGDGVAEADAGFPLRADGREVGGEGVGGSAAIAAVGDDDTRGGQGDSGVVGGDGGILPCFDFAEEDAGHGVCGELQRMWETGEVVGDADRTGAFRDLDKGLHAGELPVGEGSVGGAEVDGAGFDLLDAAAAADGLVVDVHGGMTLAEGGGPARHERVNKGAARAVEVGGPA